MENLVTTFWQNKKVLVTGHTGFKGSWLSLWLGKMGANVVGFSLSPPTTPNLFDLANVHDSLFSHNVDDIRNYADIFQVVKTHRPEIVIHMAAQSLVLPSYDQPIETYATNVMGTVNLLEALRQVDCAKAIINVTSDKCYDNKKQNGSYTENDTLGGHDPYSNSKACSELVTSAYRNSYFKENQIGLASARAGNVIGGGDWALYRLIPDIMTHCMKKQTIPIRHPQAIRPWQHVLEPLKGYLLLAQSLYKNPSDYSEAWNFGPQEEDAAPVSWIVDYIVNQWNENTTWMIEKNSERNEACYLKLDSSKAKTRLNWQPHWTLTTGLDKTIEWYKQYQSGKNMQEVTMVQIQQYAESTITAVKLEESIQ